jgi:hypothetical protein
MRCCTAESRAVRSARSTASAGGNGVVGHGVRDEDDRRPVGLQGLGQGLVVGPGGLYRADELGDTAGLPLAGLQVRPEGGEARLGVGDHQRFVQYPGVSQADLGHMLGLGDVDPHQEPVPLRAEVLLQFTKALDSDCI